MWVQDPLARIHAPNESIDLEELKDSIVAEALFLAEYGRRARSSSRAHLWLQSVRRGAFRQTAVKVAYRRLDNGTDVGQPRAVLLTPVRISTHVPNSNACRSRACDND